MSGSYVGALGAPFSGGGLIGGAGPPQTATVPQRQLGNTALPYVAKVYNTDWSFRASLEPLDRPAYQASLNGGLQPMTLQLAAPPASTVCAPGNLIRVTEQGGDGIPVISGIVEDLPDVVDPKGQTVHQVLISPFVAELADTRFNATYANPTEVAQMLRDAVRQTAHCQFNWSTIPDTGVFLPALGQDAVVFNGTTVADVANTVILMAGSTYSWHCDENGTVWLQPMGSVADWSVKRGADYNRRERSGSIKALKNYIPVVGGVPTGSTLAASGLYSNGSSQAQYGLRAWDPPLTFPTIADTLTLQTIANTLGGLFDRVQNRLIITLPRFAPRITLGSIGAPTIRTWEPVQDPLQETDPGAGAYSAVFQVLDVTTDGPQQIVTLGDLPYSTTDNWTYLMARLVQRQAVSGLVVPPPSLTGHTVMQVGQAGGAGGGRWTIVDSNAQVRVDIGNLPPYTDSSGVFSAAENGIRILDKNGLIISDPVGLVGVMSYIGVSSQGPGATTTSTSYVVTPGATPISFSFTLNRQIRCQFRALLQAKTSGAGGTLAYTRAAIYDAVPSLVASTGDFKYDKGVVGVVGVSFDLVTGGGSVAAIGPGTYTARLEVKVDAGQTMYVDQGYILGFAQGA